MPTPVPMPVPMPAPGLVPLTSGPTVSAKAVPVAFSGRSAGLSMIATAAVQQGRDGGTTLGDVARHDLYAWERDPWDVVEVARAEGDPSVPDPVRPHLVAPDPAERGPAEPDPAERLPQGLDPGNDPYVDWSPPPVMRPGIDAPELAGYGAVSPAVVRALMGAAPWVRVTEPVYRGAEPPPSVDSYRPSAELDRHVRVRDVTCVVPGCHVPASRCDVDHLVPWPTGPTAADNLHALCRRHHLLRTHAGHELVVAPDGTRRWRTPLGQTLWSTPDGVIGRENDARGAAEEDPSIRRRRALPGTSRAGVARWGRTRAIPRLRDGEVDRRLRDLDDAEADDPVVDDLWPDDVSAVPRSAA